jgi:hypothetical protein
MPADVLDPAAAARSRVTTFLYATLSLLAFAVAPAGPASWVTEFAMFDDCLAGHACPPGSGGTGPGSRGPDRYPDGGGQWLTFPGHGGLCAFLTVANAALAAPRSREGPRGKMALSRIAWRSGSTRVTETL